MEPLMTAKDVAARWQVHKTFIYVLARAGMLPSIRLNRRGDFRFHPADVKEYEQDHREDGPPNLAIYG